MKHLIFGFAFALVAMSPLAAEEQETVETEVVKTQEQQLLACEEAVEDVELDVAASYKKTCKRCNNKKS